ncbi:PEP-CTERM sorting domain-containing protein [Desulfohalovibrio reitneri]|uniref:PEP-CTERM sorting domain-containing protein n=1 Tax=Desulfohalovibrio reitneri TaxID=1307759 RepID=UPI0004A7722B|nr:PEP-CTERM sorting domain-containing protein [Desulfohalovibrio reitneri]
MLKILPIPLLTLALTLFLASGAFAFSQTYFGEDTGLGENTRLTSYPNAASAESSFLANLTGVGTEDFESYASGTGPPVDITFPGAGTATMLGNGDIETVASGTNGFGRYAVSGDNFWNSSSEFSISFDTPIAAFGFWGIDIGDFDGQLTATVENGVSNTYTVPNTISGPGGSVLFWGLIDTDNPFTSVTFGNTEAGVDVFAFDDMTIGSLEQVGPNPVPEPTSMALLAAGAIPLGFSRLRKRFKK